MAGPKGFSLGPTLERETVGTSAFLFSITNEAGKSDWDPGTPQLQVSQTRIRSPVVAYFRQLITLVSLHLPLSLTPADVHWIAYAGCGRLEADACENTMSQQSEIPKSPPFDPEQLRQRLADTLLAAQSPVENENAFKKDRAEYVSLVEKQKELSTSLTSLLQASQEVTQAEQNASRIAAELDKERALLGPLAQPLGESVFAGFRNGQIPEDARIAPRNALQLRIDSLNQQKAILAAGKASGTLEQASLTAQQLKLAGQIKLEELKINSHDRALGNEILNAGAEASYRCVYTENILAKIASHRQRIDAMEQERKKAEQALLDLKVRLAASLAIPAIHDSQTLKASISKVQAEQSAVQSRIAGIRIAVVDKAAQYEWLRDIPELAEQLRGIDKPKNVPAARRLSVWPLAVVVIAGHLLMNFGKAPLNLTSVGLLILYALTAVGGLALLSYYKPELAQGERRYKSALLLVVFSIVSIILLFSFQNLAEHAVNQWATAPAWAKSGRGLLFDLPRRTIVLVGRAYRDTFSILAGTRSPDSYAGYFRDHMLSVGLCEELVKLLPALLAFMAFTGTWAERTREFNSRLVHLAMIGGLAFGLGEAVHYHFAIYAPSQSGWGIYATRFLSLVTVHAVWAGLSAWILAHVTGGWIRFAFSTFAQGLGPLGGCLLIGATVLLPNLLHTSHNLSNDPLWRLTWDMISLALFAWVVPCSSLAELLPDKFRTGGTDADRFATPSSVAASVPQQPALAIGEAAVPSGIASPDHATAVAIEPVPAAVQQISLWSPNAAGWWSILFTPVFGAWLHAKNWTQLGFPEKAKQSMRWVYAALALVVIGIVAPILSSGFLRFAQLGLLVAWWCYSGNEQLRYVTQHCPEYARKKWGTPLSIAGLALLGLLLHAYARIQDSETQGQMQRLAGRWSAKMEQSTVDPESRITTVISYTGTATYALQGTSETQGVLTMTFVAPNGVKRIFQFLVTSRGTWSFDGLSLLEYVQDVTVEPGDATTRAEFGPESDVVQGLKKSLQETKSWGSVNFLSADKIQLTDAETGGVATMERIKDASGNGTPKPATGS